MAAGLGAAAGRALRVLASRLSAPEVKLDELSVVDADVRGGMVFQAIGRVTCVYQLSFWVVLVCGVVFLCCVRIFPHMHGVVWDNNVLHGYQVLVYVDGESVPRRLSQVNATLRFAPGYNDMTLDIHAQARTAQPQWSLLLHQ